ncbi:MAG: YkgJ family cysteine cluster protein [Nitrospirota bacterium]
MKKSHSNITQIVPYDWCSRCDVCCRFPEKESFLAPYFTKDEISSAMQSGMNASSFTANSGCKITLTPYKEGYICPAFNPETTLCKIYDVRPIDCIIYPFAIMRSADGMEIVLGLDMKCPYVREVMYIDPSPILDIISENPGLIGPYQEDVSPVVVLKKFTLIL